MPAINEAVYKNVGLASGPGISPVDWNLPDSLQTYFLHVFYCCYHFSIFFFPLFDPDKNTKVSKLSTKLIVIRLNIESNNVRKEINYFYM